MSKFIQKRYIGRSAIVIAVAVQLVISGCAVPGADDSDLESAGRKKKGRNVVVQADGYCKMECMDHGVDQCNTTWSNVYVDDGSYQEKTSITCRDTYNYDRTLYKKSSTNLCNTHLHNPNFCSGYETPLSANKGFVCNLPGRENAADANCEMGPNGQPIFSSDTGLVTADYEPPPVNQCAQAGSTRDYFKNNYKCTNGQWAYNGAASSDYGSQSLQPPMQCTDESGRSLAGNQPQPANTIALIDSTKLANINTPGGGSICGINMRQSCTSTATKVMDGLPGDSVVRLAGFHKNPNDAEKQGANTSGGWDWVEVVCSSEPSYVGAFGWIATNLLTMTSTIHSSSYQCAPAQPAICN